MLNILDNGTFEANLYILIASYILQVNGFFSVTSSASIVLTLCCISVDRYVAVTKPLKYKAIITVKRAVSALIGVWLQGILIGMLPIWGWSKYEYHPGTLHCSPSWTNNCSLYAFLSLVGFVIPITVMVITYTNIFLAIRKHARKVSTVRWKTRVKTGAKGGRLTNCNTNMADSAQSPENNADITLLYGDTCTDRLTTSPTEIFYQDGLTCNGRNLDLISNDQSAMYLSSPGGRIPNNAIVATCNKNASSKVSFVKDSTQSSSGDTTLCNEVRSGSQVLSRGTVLEPRRRATNMLRSFPLHHRSRRRAARQLPREYKVAKTGLLLLIVFLVLWVPYLVVHSCAASVNVSETVFQVAMWCVYMNGIANPVVYALSNGSVKLALKDVVHRMFSTGCWCFTRG